MSQLLTIVLAFGLSGCSEQKEPTKAQDSTKQIKKKMTITEVLEKHTDTWMSIPGVLGTAQSEKDGKPAITIFIEQKSSTIEEKIPKSVEGYPVVLEVTGEIKALDN